MARTAKSKTKKATTKRRTTVKVKRTQAKKPTTRKTIKRKVAKKTTTIKIGKSSKPYTKTQIASYLSDFTDGNVNKKDVTNILEGLKGLIISHLKGPGVFTVPGVCKFKTRRKPATKARKGINPFTGELTTFKAKPAKTVVKILPLKAVKDEIQ